MSHDLAMLGWAIALGFIYVFVSGAITTSHRGLKWNAGNRDGQVPPLTGLAGHSSRAVSNMLETFPFFAAVSLAVVAAGKSSSHSALGADLYFWGRVVYLPTYLIGIPYFRTVVWLVTIIGIFIELGALLR